MDEREVVQKATDIINGGTYTEKEARATVKALKDSFQFKVAGKVLAVLRENDPNNIWYTQQLALCVYKNEELMPGTRFKEALQLLEGIGLRDPDNVVPETLGLGGAVYKRKWEYEGQLEYLYQALYFYREAWAINSKKDMGYGGVNAAYVLDILSSRARTVAVRSGKEPGESEEALEFKEKARKLRMEMAEKLPGFASEIEQDEERDLSSEYWYLVTMAEIYFGLGTYEEARNWLDKAKMLATEWEQQTTFKQFVSIARFQGHTPPDEGQHPDQWDLPWKTLYQFLGEKTGQALSCYRGKVGLALSGGGFRASLFHIGVLARLAEMDVLRSVEVISTVSGGSIVGAHYYLMVKHLLESKEDGEITKEDYVEIVRRLCKDFLDGVQENIRTMAVADFRQNLKMIWSKHYGRSHRMGELYEEILYSKVSDGHDRGRPRYMHELLIQPKGETGEFNPKFSNWRRRAKVPALLLNATTLNTGHNWRFTACSMGEPPGMMGDEVDKNARYRRLYYKQAPTKTLQNYRLGYAVSASACVPGLFDPLTLEDLYPDKVVRLVDGGVHDNQGVQGLLDEGCKYVLCSDSSGQMDDKDEPSDGILPVLLRSNSISMDRVREAEYQDLRGRVDSKALQGLFFIHLKKDLHVCSEDWIKCQDPTSEKEKEEQPIPYRVDPGIQRLLAKVRTDLDSFSEVEAYALMSSAYLMTEQQFSALQTLHEKEGESGNWGGYDVNVSGQEWDFIKLKPLMEIQEVPNQAGNDLKKQLAAGSGRVFKAWKLDDTLRTVGWVLAVIVAIILFTVIRKNWESTIFSLTVRNVVLAASVLLLPVVPAVIKKVCRNVEWLSDVLKWLLDRAAWLFPDKAAKNIGKDFFLAFFGFLAAKIHLWKFDKMFLERGKLSNLLKKKG